jgi:tetratricopeptide (TPR) repeat protein
LHRNGNNEKALKKINAINNDNSYQYQHLLAQVNYKLGKYDKSVGIYQGILQSNKDGAEGEEPLDQDEITDITTNYLACQSSV